MAIIDALKPIGELYKEERHQECIRLLEKLWEKCPSPKEQDGNTFLILLYITKILQVLNRHDDAIEWALKGFLYSGTRNLAGESEMLLGECAYEGGRMELAQDMFATARIKGGKRIFREAKAEYLELAERKKG